MQSDTDGTDQPSRLGGFPGLERVSSTESNRDPVNQSQARCVIAPAGSACRLVFLVSHIRTWGKKQSNVQKAVFFTLYKEKGCTVVKCQRVCAHAHARLWCLQSVTSCVKPLRTMHHTHSVQGRKTLSLSTSQSLSPSYSSFLSPSSSRSWSPYKLCLSF